MATIEEISESIKKDMESRWAGVKPSSNQLPQSSSVNKSMKLNTMVQWQIPIELCPSCMSRLRGKEPEYLKGWTNLAKDTWAKKKAPKAPEVAEDTGISGVVKV